jgi:hypothetical protein
MKIRNYEESWKDYLLAERTGLGKKLQPGRAL